MEISVDSMSANSYRFASRYKWQRAMRATGKVEEREDLKSQDLLEVSNQDVRTGQHEASDWKASW